MCHEITIHCYINEPGAFSLLITSSVPGITTSNVQLCWAAKEFLLMLVSTPTLMTSFDSTLPWTSSIVLSVSLEPGLFFIYFFLWKFLNFLSFCHVQLYLWVGRVVCQKKTYCKDGRRFDVLRCSRTSAWKRIDFEKIPLSFTPTFCFFFSCGVESALDGMDMGPVDIFFFFHISCHFRLAPALQ